LNEPIKENMFKQSERTYPVDLVYTSDKIYKAEILIPGGYSASYIPAPVHVNNDFIKMDYSNNLEGNKLTVYGNYNLKHRIFAANKYSSLKYVMNQVIKTFNDKVVLEKK
jgi:hypothetical protein